MPRNYNYRPVSKLCKECAIDFIGHSNKKYCSSICLEKQTYKIRKNQEKRISNLDFFLKEKLRLATNRGKHEVLISFDYLKKLWHTQKGLCAISKVPMTYLKGQGQLPTNISLDRIDSSLPYQEGNIQLVCVQINFMKHQLNLDQLKFWCERIING